jgi:DNA-packaging protein gp3
MSAPQGNKFWEARSSHGRQPIFKKPEALWTACCEYFEWIEQNPLYEAKAFASGGDVTIENLPKMRAMTVGSLCIFLDISPETWRDYRSRQDFVGIVGQVDEIIRTQKFQGASAGLLNANIIARDLGLADRSEHTGKDGQPIQVEMLTEQERRRAMQILMQAALDKKTDA